MGDEVTDAALAAMADAVDLLLAVVNMADTLADARDGLSHLTCEEFESIAAVLVAGGMDDEVRKMLIGHAMGDDSGLYLHHDLYECGDPDDAVVTAHVKRIREGL